jgi:putative protease
MGIDSLKIEGRMKSLNYVASATAVYRQAIDLYCSRPEDFYKALPKFQEELEKSDNRGFTEAFFSSSPAREIMNYSDMNYFRNYSTLGVIKRIIHKKWALLEVKAQFTNSDVIEYLAPDTGIWVKTVLKDLRDLLLEPVHSANSGEYIMIPYNKSIPIGTIFRISKTSNFTK